MKLSQAIEGFLLFKRVTLSESTLAGYASCLEKLQAYFPDNPDISAITPENITAFLIYLRDTPQDVSRGIARREAITLSGKSRKNIHIALSSLWTWAVENGFTPHHIMRRVPRPKAETRAINPFTREDMIAILGACEFYTYARNGKVIKAQRTTALRDKAIVKTLLDTGLRVSELCQARVCDFDARNHKLKVMGKGSKERILHLDVRTTQAIWHYLTTRETQPGDPLFANYKNSEFLTRRNLLTVLSRIGKTAGVENVHPHRFRHTFAINFLRNGGNIYALQEMLGHASLEMCKRYLNLAQADTETAHRKASPVANWKL